MPPPVASIPGVKLGLANAVILVVLYLRGGRAAFAVNISRILLAGFLFGGAYGMLYSLSGAALSLSVMFAAKKRGVFGLIGVSVLGGTAHNAGQLLLSAAIIKSAGLFYYMPALVISGTAAGILTGFSAWIIVERVGKIIKTDI